MEQKGDFIGFEFAGVHSSDLNVIRVSDGDRFDEELIPEVKDVTSEVPGMDGEYYFGSTYGPRKFEISIAYDKLTEEQFRKVRNVYGCKRVGELIFDERPYKKYLAKIESPIEFSYVCFDEPKKVETAFDGIYGPTTVMRATEGKSRVYKGEGKITFVCYFPFAKSCYKVLPSADEESGWAVSSGILTGSEYAAFDRYNNGVINIYNAGDLPTGFRLYLPSSAAGQNLTLSYTSSTGAQPVQLTTKAMEMKGNDIGVVIDTNSNLIIGVSQFDLNDQSYLTSGNLYNEYVNSGQFFKLQPNAKTDGATLEITGGSGDITIFYDYLYF